MYRKLDQGIVDVSIVITTFNEGHHLDSLLEGIQNQDFETLTFEVLLVEAGNYQEGRAKAQLKEKSSFLKFYNFPGISRTKALNFLFQNSIGRLIVRLDGRSIIESDYIKRIHQLSITTNAENVGGVMLPIGNSNTQNLIAKLMSHPVSFGGGKSRDINYVGYVDSVYLGAYNRQGLEKMKSDFFDVKHPQISEDSDLNFRIRKSGGSVFLDSSIKIKYHAREDLRKYFRLCYNYGVARGLFILKHKRISAFRQAIPIFITAIAVIFSFLGFCVKSFHLVLVVFLFLYFIILLLSALMIRPSSLFDLFKAFLAFIGCHFFWTFGLFSSPLVFYSNNYKGKFDVNTIS